MSVLKEVKVPDIGGHKNVPVIEVLVKVGDTVKVDDALVTLESDKATMDVPSSTAGVVKEVKIKVGQGLRGHGRRAARSRRWRRGRASPRAWRTAMLEFDPVPQGDRSARPGRNVVQVRKAPSGSSLAASWSRGSSGSPSCLARPQSITTVSPNSPTSSLTTTKPAGGSDRPEPASMPTSERSTTCWLPAPVARSTSISSPTPWRSWSPDAGGPGGGARRRRPGSRRCIRAEPGRRARPPGSDAHRRGRSGCGESRGVPRPRRAPRGSRRPFRGSAWRRRRR
mgnify:CR=1 FL=1